MALHTNMEAVNEYYRKHLGKIILKTSSSSSSETISSLENLDEEELDEERRMLENDVIASNFIDDDSQSMGINSIMVKDSTDVQIGNRLICKGGLTINLIDGVSSMGFEGSHSWTDVEKKLKATVKAKSGPKKSFTRQQLIFSTAAFLALPIIGTAIYFFIKELTKVEAIKVITRKQWNATDPPLDIIFEELRLPVGQYILYNTVTPECFNVKDCSDNVLAIQIYHLSRGFDFDDIAYNFLIAGDGSIYEGRGWKIQGAHTSGYNRVSIAVAFIGNFERKLPTDKQIKAGLALFEEGVRVGAVTPDYKIFGALQLRNTQSPGEKFFNEVVKKWKHWGDPFEDLN